ncbi:hypothetical protein PHYBLDRAFT_169287 [Phycomyces blakesleeanus NRRL 1555(-)]|uniref:OTU domain-containing protein n=1 Tax=Phycomyces blakesleeanus (strain ATCC 8743b / DSM 1359 / FGSC 10004 / NBRC 33097 / NRRL 1555) TaxID=763407 RepID=A0A162NCA5_PHYB8|nr:hypothetical protein PHYBLDRAFT_169287 [Phycomyces blakesleeanus NRRL 1555(-)]OAD73028.1 hypothetical protein PHYBLDRAFT_169287 [Phycomyces blakesleeanus NRRL 1555(-)]|eukprot:XP_018291068.1 hypothetical protein PHYBLDRAFT_169287 [Phycomyces blakesleeanus NRRL 1555(-)]
MAMVDELVDNAGEIIDHPNVVFPLASEVKAPGRPKHVKRKTALPKDFVRHKHRHLLVQKNKNDIRSILKEGLKEVMKEFLEEEPLKNIIKEIKKETQFAEKQEPLEEAKTTNFAKKQEPLEEAEKYSSGIKRPKHLQDDYWYDLPSPKKQNKNVHDFALPAQIDQAAISLTFNPKSDVWCGFRVFAHLKEGGEDQFPLVKKMLATMATHGKLYEHNFGMDVAEVTEVIAFGSEIDPALGENIPSCPSSMWFSAPDCAQIIADTYNEPVCVYSDDRSVLPVTFLPLHDRKPLKRKPLPMVLHHVHGCHWTTIKVKPHVHRSWPKTSDYTGWGQGVTHRNDGCLPDKSYNTSLFVVSPRHAQEPDSAVLSGGHMPSSTTCTRLLSVLSPIFCLGLLDHFVGSGDPVLPTLLKKYLRVGRIIPATNEIWAAPKSAKWIYIIVLALIDSLMPLKLEVL